MARIGVGGVDTEGGPISEVTVRLLKKAVPLDRGTDQRAGMIKDPGDASELNPTEPVVVTHYHRLVRRDPGHQIESKKMLIISLIKERNGSGDVSSIPYSRRQGLFLGRSARITPARYYQIPLAPAHYRPRLQTPEKPIAPMASATGYSRG